MISEYRVNNKFINFLHIIKVLFDIIFASVLSLNFVLLERIFSGKMKILIVKKEFESIENNLNKKIKINRLINRYIKIYNRELLIYSLKK
jgi:hypothetical protein